MLKILELTFKEVRAPVGVRARARVRVRVKVKVRVVVMVRIKMGASCGISSFPWTHRFLNGEDATATINASPAFMPIPL